MIYDLWEEKKQFSDLYRHSWVSLLAHIDGKYFNIIWLTKWTYYIEYYNVLIKSHSVAAIVLAGGKVFKRRPDPFEPD